MHDVRLNALSCFILVFNFLLMSYYSAAKVLTKTGKRAHIIPLLKSLHWLPVNLRINFCNSFIGFKDQVFHGRAPDNATEMVLVYESGQPLISLFLSFKCLTADQELLELFLSAVKDFELHLTCMKGAKED